MSASGKKEPEEDGSQADNAEKLSISPKEDNRKAGENAAAENDEAERSAKRLTSFSGLRRKQNEHEKF